MSIQHFSAPIFISIFVCMYVHIHMYHILFFQYIVMQAYKNCVYVHVYAYVYVCTYVSLLCATRRTHAHAHASFIPFFIPPTRKTAVWFDSGSRYLCKCVFLYIYIHIYVCVYIYIYIHTWLVSPFWHLCAKTFKLVYMWHIRMFLVAMVVATTAAGGFTRVRRRGTFLSFCSYLITYFACLYYSFPYLLFNFF
jgi:hypothetical protein